MHWQYLDQGNNQVHLHQQNNSNHVTCSPTKIQNFVLPLLGESQDSSGSFPHKNTTLTYFKDNFIASIYLYLILEAHSINPSAKIDTNTVNPRISGSPQISAPRRLKFKISASPSPVLWKSIEATKDVASDYRHSTFAVATNGSEDLLIHCFKPTEPNLCSRSTQAKGVISRRLFKRDRILLRLLMDWHIHILQKNRTYLTTIWEKLNKRPPRLSTPRPLLNLKSRICNIHQLKPVLSGPHIKWTPAWFPKLSSHFYHCFNVK